MKLETPRLIIRELLPEDAEFFATMWSDPAVTKYSGGPRNYQKIVDFILKESSAPEKKSLDRWTVTEKTTDKPLGECGFIEKDFDGTLETELIYYFSPDSWGKGYATEAAREVLTYGFGLLGLSRIIAIIEAENAASERVAIKLGFELEREVIRNQVNKKIYVAKRP